MTPRLLIALLPSIAAALAAAIACLAAGWGWLAALLAYSVAGSAVLLAWLGLAALLDASERTSARACAGAARPAPGLPSAERLPTARGRAA